MHTSTVVAMAIGGLLLVGAFGSGSALAQVDAKAAVAAASATPAPAATPAAAGSGTADAARPGSLDPADVADYRLGVGDVVAVTVLNADQFNRKLRIDSTGKVSLPLLGNMQVMGLTPHEMEVVIADALREKYMNDPQVSVFVEESASLRFSIEGAVRTPNVYPLKGRVTLLQAIAAGGGFTKVADLSQVRVIRGTGKEQQILIFDAEKIKDGQAADPVILGNDAIIAMPSTGKTVFYETLDTIRGIVSFGTIR
ncbi:MAG: polysaccharide biosynthesis/export family protein [Burkholderiales bacterium]